MTEQEAVYWAAEFSDQELDEFADRGDLALLLEAMGPGWMYPQAPK